MRETPVMKDNMTISAEIIEDSLHPETGSRLTTFVLRYPRFIHSELMTHRALSRNASSSRAIPVEKFIAWTKEDPAMPVAWFYNQRGMQGTEYLTPEDRAKAEGIWLAARDAVLPFVQQLMALNVHKQTTNRLMEPWHHISVIATSSDWANFFGLRYHKDAQPEIRELARKMLRIYTKQTPVTRVIGDWHLPYVSAKERSSGESIESLRKCSVARCARVSFNNHDGTTPDMVKDVALHDRLVVQEPLHASPAEHQAQAAALILGQSGNLSPGWTQYRKTLPNEVIRTCPKLLPEDDRE